MCRGNTEHWVSELPSALLGLRASLRQDTQISAAEMVYGEAIRLPGDFFQPNTREISDTPNFLHELRNKIVKLSSVPKRNIKQGKIFVHPELNDCSHVFVRCDFVTKPLTPPYTGPYKVIHKTDKYFKILQGESVKIISIDRLKPAFMLETDEQANATNKVVLPDHPVVTNKATMNVNNEPKVTRSGRIVKPVVRFAQ